MQYLVGHCRMFKDARNVGRNLPPLGDFCMIFALFLHHCRDSSNSWFIFIMRYNLHLQHHCRLSLDFITIGPLLRFFLRNHPNRAILTCATSPSGTKPLCMSRIIELYPLASLCAVRNVSWSLSMWFMHLQPGHLVKEVIRLKFGYMPSLSGGWFWCNHYHPCFLHL